MDIESDFTLSKPFDIFLLKDEVPLLDKASVYKLSCGECPTLYVGQTSQRLCSRQSKPWSALNCGTKPVFADLCRRYNHDFRKSSYSLLHACTKGRLMNRSEETETTVHAVELGPLLLNEFSATFITPFVRYYFDFTPYHVLHSIESLLKFISTAPPPAYFL